MTPSEQKTFNALRALVNVVDEQTNASMLALLEGSWDSRVKLRELSEQRKSALKQAHAALALAEKAEAESKELVVRITLTEAKEAAEALRFCDLRVAAANIEDAIKAAEGGA